MKIKNESRIIICPQCSGTGKTYVRESLYESENIECEYCAGNRVVLETETITHKKINKVRERSEKD